MKRGCACWRCCLPHRPGLPCFWAAAQARLGGSGARGLLHAAVGLAPLRRCHLKSNQPADCPGLSWDHRRCCRWRQVAAGRGTAPCFCSRPAPGRSHKALQLAVRRCGAAARLCSRWLVIKGSKADHPGLAWIVRCAALCAKLQGQGVQRPLLCALKRVLELPMAPPFQLPFRHDPAPRP